MAAGPPRLQVGIVGTGRAGAVLGAALAAAGHPVVAASGVSAASRRRAGELLPGVPLVDPPEVLRRAELAVLAVPDDALPGLVSGLAEVGAVRRGGLLAHLSGRYGVRVLDPATARGALPLALHPVLTFSGTPADLPRLAGAVFGLAAPDQLRPVAEALVLELGGEPAWIAEGDRPLYHAALAHGANHLVTLVATASDLLRAAGVQRPDRMLGPLLQAALDNTLAHGDAALTGPVARGDAQTVRAHLAALSVRAPEAVAAYVALARATADRALAAGRLAPGTAEHLLDALATDGAPA